MAKETDGNDKSYAKIFASQ